jgi:hypothetical protein
MWRIVWEKSAWNKVKHSESMENETFLNLISDEDSDGELSCLSKSTNIPIFPPPPPLLLYSHSPLLHSWQS